MPDWYVTLYTLNDLTFTLLFSSGKKIIYPDE